MEPGGRPAKLRKIERGDQAICRNISPDQQVSSPAVHDLDASVPKTAEIPEPVAAFTAPKSALGGSAEQSSETAADTNVKPLSKNQQKKLRKRQEWEAKQPLRKAKKKELRKAKKARDRVRKANEDEASREARASLRRDGQLLPVTVIFDCSYDELMYEKEVVSLGSQLTRCYSENRNARFKAHLVVSSFGGRLKERFDTVLKGTYKSWSGFVVSDAAFDVAANQAQQEMKTHKGEALGGAFAPQQQHDGNGANAQHNPPSDSVGDEQTEAETIYLSSDSDYTLTELKPFSTYIIGGLVDRNRYKGKCHRAALSKNIKTARLPIGEYLEMSTRHILTTNHVLEIMLKWLELRDWGAAFTAVIPKRKGGVLKSDDAPKAVDGDAQCVIEESGQESDDDSGEASPDAANVTSREDDTGVSAEQAA